MEIREVMRRFGGVAPVRVMLAAGVSRHQIEVALAAGELRRVRRGWLAAPDADEMRVLAATSGVVLTCVTQARRLGLWVLAGTEVHVAAPAHSGRVPPGIGHVHWGKPLIPRDPTSVEDPLENVLEIVAGCQPPEIALAIWDSARNQQVVDIDALARLPLSSAAGARAHPSPIPGSRRSSSLD